LTEKLRGVGPTFVCKTINRRNATTPAHDDRGNAPLKSFLNFLPAPRHAL
jgi:hypothetical protein